VQELHEFNPMLGHRGCRLGITYPEITAMQVRAIFEAACAVQKAGGVLSKAEAMRYRKKYRKILKQGEEECPKPPPKEPGKRGRQKKPRCLNLLERLRDFENDVLRFMSVQEVPFTNNQAERDLRMTKVQQKISGCFRSMEGAKIFCRIRGFLSTCRKNKVSPTDALRGLFEGTLPVFMSQ
jgi:transposase